jgi:hypothetical protein
MDLRQVGARDVVAAEIEESRASEMSGMKFQSPSHTHAGDNMQIEMRTFAEFEAGEDIELAKRHEDVP